MATSLEMQRIITRNAVFKKTATSRKRYVVELGGAGSGKSTDIAIRLIKKLSVKKGANLLCIRKVGESNRDSTFAELKKAILLIFGEMADKYWAMPAGRASALYLRHKENGNEIIFRGCNNADDIQKIKSVTFANGDLTDIWIEEASEITEQDFNILDDRLRGILPEGLFYQIHMSLNPVLCWVKSRFYDLPDQNAITNHSTYLDNRFVDKQYAERMEERRKRDPEGFTIYGLGEWGQLGGLILSNFVVKDFAINSFDFRSYGQDFGFNHKNALLDVGHKDGDVYICRELVCTQKDTTEIIQIATASGWLKNIEMWCDSAEPDRIQMWQKAGFRARSVEKEKGSVRGQIEYLKGIVSKSNVVSRTIYIHPSCRETISEIRQWRWKFDNKLNDYIDEPMSFNDDCMAALRYSIERNRKPSMGTATARVT